MMARRCRRPAFSVCCMRWSTAIATATRAARGSGCFASTLARRAGDRRLAGWKAYPVRLDDADRLPVPLRAQVTVVYSSTCPCSAALSRHWVEQAFLAAFGRDDRDGAGGGRRVAEAARDGGHAARSEAVVSVALPDDGATLGLIDLIDRIEHALGTPVQTAVKRADEQAFAVLNGGNPDVRRGCRAPGPAALDGCNPPHVRI